MFLKFPFFISHKIEANNYNIMTNLVQIIENVEDMEDMQVVDPSLSKILRFRSFLPIVETY